MEKSYVIAIIKEIYETNRTGTNALTWITNDQNEPTIYNSLEDAKETVKKLDEETYHTANGEAGRPEYLIMSEKDYEKLKHKQEDGNNYMWLESECLAGRDYEGNQCACGKCKDCIIVMENEDIEFIREHTI